MEGGREEEETVCTAHSCVSSSGEEMCSHSELLRRPCVTGWQLFQQAEPRAAALSKSCLFARKCRRLRLLQSCCSSLCCFRAPDER